VPQPTAPPHAPSTWVVTQNSSFFFILQTGPTTTTTTLTTTTTSTGAKIVYLVYSLAVGLDGLGFGPKWGKKFSISVPVQTSPEAHLAYSTMDTRALSQR
jgi:hypothetical protein